MLNQYQEQQARLPLIVVEGDGSGLFARNWLSTIRLDWKSINMVKWEVGQWFGQESALFEEGLGTLKSYEANSIVQPGAQPRFYTSVKPAQPLYFVQPGSGGVGVPGKWGHHHPCTVCRLGSAYCPSSEARWQILAHLWWFQTHSQSSVQTRPLPTPRIEDLFAKLTGGQSFTKLDVSHTYEQILLDVNSRNLVIINTQHRLYRYSHLSFGVSSAPGIFQWVRRASLVASLG